MTLSLPKDLEPLPDFSWWDELPDDVRLTAAEVRTALWQSSGNVSQAADLLKTTSGHLRRYVRFGTQLYEELREIKEQLLDQAEANIQEALYSDDPKRMDPMARFVLTREFARNRGFGTSRSRNTASPNGNQPVQIVWGNELQSPTT
jgi:hypothetical protein